MYFYDNSMTRQDWEDVDRGPRYKAAKFVKGFLESKGFAVEIQFTKGRCCYDFLATARLKNARPVRIAVECKDRTSKYNDVMIEEEKYDSILARKRRGEFDKAIAVNTYCDGELRTANVENPNFTKKNLPCPATSRVKGATRARVSKPCILFTEYKTFSV